MPFVRVTGTEAIPIGRGALIENDGVARAVFNAGGGRFSAGRPVCPCHGFDLDTGRGLVEPALAIPVYPLRVTGTDVEVEIP